MDDGQEKIDFQTERMLALYARGVQRADVADDFESSVRGITDRMSEFPDELAEAKLKLLQHRNSKHRRVNALSTDIQLDWLEDVKKKDVSTLTAKEISTVQKIGEAADRRADLNEGKATEITENRGTTM
jgi:hypothetical protein